MRQITKLNAVVTEAKAMLRVSEGSVPWQLRKEKLQRALEDLETVTNVNQKLIYVGGEGFYKSPLMIVGQAPGATEEAEGKPFASEAGLYLRETMIELGFDMDTLYYMTYVVKVRPEDNRAPTKEEIASWRPHLLEELSEAKLIIAVGETAAKALKGDPRVRFIFKPTQVLKNPKKAKPLWLGQLKEILDEYNKLLSKGLRT